MAANSIGLNFRVTTFGESHGIALGCIIDGMPPNIELSEQDLQHDLDRRKPGQSRYTTARQEGDVVQILSGVFEGKTTGTSIGLIIRNTDQRSHDYTNIKDKFRPGHADFTYHHKYGIRDYRGGGRSSARETAMRVAAGAVAKKYLASRFGISVNAYVSQIGAIEISPFSEKNIDWQQVNSNPFFTPDEQAIAKFDELMRALIKEGNSIGAKVNLVIQNVPIGLGEPVFDRLDAQLAHALMGINAAKGVEIGAGFACVSQKGSEHRDQMTKNGFLTNNAGGILGGISSGQDILAKVAFKPTSSIKVAGSSLDVNNNEVEVITKGRHDPCVGIRAVPIVEAMAAIVLMDSLLSYQAQCGTLHK